MKPKAWSSLDSQIIRMNLEDKTYSLATPGFRNPSEI